MNLVIKTIEERRSIRNYTQEPLTPEEINTLADMGLHAPSAMNLQSCRISVVTDKELLSEIEQLTIEEFKRLGETKTVERIESRNNKLFYNSPAVFFISMPKNSGKITNIDSGIMVQNIALAAKSLGLESVIIAMVAVAFSGEKQDYVKERLGFLEGYEFGICIAVGHGAMESAPHEIDRSKINIV